MTKEKIDQFFASKKFAVIGVSDDKRKFGGTIYKEMIKAGYDTLPVNPKLDEFAGQKCYPSINDLPDETDAIVIVTKPKYSINVIKEAEKKGIKQIWLQQGAEDEATIKYAEENGMNVIYKKCAVMFANPKGIHGFHAFLSKVFGTYPK